MTRKNDLHDAFTAAYDALNTEQKHAVDTIEGPVMVIAGPGTGKTQVLTLRIANILRRTDTPPESILALTFTDAGATAMRNRLRTYLGAAAYRVTIHTFHSFAGELIRQYPDAYPRIIGGQVANDLDGISVLENCLLDSAYRLLRPAGNPEYYLKPLKSMLAELKKEYVTPDRLAQIIAAQEDSLAQAPRYHEKGAHKGKERADYAAAAKSIAKNRELLSVYRQYEASMRTARLYDFDDMIIETVRALTEHEDVLRDLQERYHYILADEHQDVNAAQNKILELLASFHDRPNLFVVGDEKQAIYRFQGASLENFLYFEDRFPGTTTISLTQNYRSGQPILDTAHHLIDVPDGPLKSLRVPLVAAAVPASETSVRLTTYPHQAVEDAALVAAVNDALDSGINAEEIAIIVRTNQMVEHLTALLRDAGLSVAPSADTDILRHPMTVHLESLMRVVVEPDDVAAVATVLNAPYWGITPPDAAIMLAAQQYDRPLSTILFDDAVRASLPLRDHAACTRMVAALRNAQQQALTERPQRVLADLVNSSGFLDAVMTHAGPEAVRVIRRLYDEIEHLVLTNRATTLADVAQLFRQYRTHQVSLTAPFINGRTDAVQIMTAHKSKGLEFVMVFLPYLTDSTWGGGKGRRSLFSIPYTGSVADALDALDDEKRLLYVAMTRAKRTLQLSFSVHQIDGKEAMVSRLLEPLPEPVTCLEVDGSDFDPAARLIATPTAAEVISNVLLPALRDRGFSATSLNTYFKNPWDYYYRSVLRIPDVQSLSLLYGTAIHAVLEHSTRHYSAAKELPAVGAMSEALTRALNALPITAADHVRLHTKGLEALAVYHDHLKATLPPLTREELKLRVSLPTGIPELPDLPLSGTIDRLDFDAEGDLLRIVDYKTGTPKSRNAIEGKTKGSDGGYKRQLVFYALLLSLHNDSRYQTDTFTLSFVEPVRGSIKEETFVVSREEVEALRTEIIAAVRALLSGAFLTDARVAAESVYADLIAQLPQFQKR